MEIRDLAGERGARPLISSSPSAAPFGPFAQSQSHVEDGGASNNRCRDPTQSVHGGEALDRETLMDRIREQATARELSEKRILEEYERWKLARDRELALQQFHSVVLSSPPAVAPSLSSATSERQIGTLDTTVNSVSSARVPLYPELGVRSGTRLGRDATVENLLPLRTEPVYPEVGMPYRVGVGVEARAVTLSPMANATLSARAPLYPELGVRSGTLLGRDATVENLLPSRMERVYPEVGLSHGAGVGAEAKAVTLSPMANSALSARMPLYPQLGVQSGTRLGRGATVENLLSSRMERVYPDVGLPHRAGVNAEARAATLSPTANLALSARVPLYPELGLRSGTWLGRDSTVENLMPRRVDHVFPEVGLRHEAGVGAEAREEVYPRESFEGWFHSAPRTEIEIGHGSVGHFPHVLDGKGSPYLLQPNQDSGSKVMLLQHQPEASPIREISASRSKISSKKRKAADIIVSCGGGRQHARELSCALCQTTATCKKNLDEHFQGKKHKAKEKELFQGKGPPHPRREEPTDVGKSKANTTKPLGNLSKAKDKKALRFAKTATEDDELPLSSIHSVGESSTGFLKEENREEVQKCVHWCQLCKVNCYSAITLANHLRGKKHKAKKLEKDGESAMLDKTE